MPEIHYFGSHFTLWSMHIHVYASMNGLNHLHSTKGVHTHWIRTGRDACQHDILSGLFGWVMHAPLKFFATRLSSPSSRPPPDSAVLPISSCLISIFEERFIMAFVFKRGQSPLSLVYGTVADLLILLHRWVSNRTRGHSFQNYLTRCSRVDAKRKSNLTRYKPIKLCSASLTA